MQTTKNLYQDGNKRQFGSTNNQSVIKIYFFTHWKNDESAIKDKKTRLYEKHKYDEEGE